MKTEEFTCQRDDLMIRGLAYIPDGDNLPIMIVSHGFLANYETTKKYAEWFAKRGYASFCFDFNGGGVGCKSEGKSLDMSVLTEAADLRAVIAYAQGREETDASDVTLMGASQGGFVSAMVAAEDAGIVRQLILFYPAFSIPDDARAGRMVAGTFDPHNIPEKLPCDYMELGRCYAADVMDIHFEDMIKPYRGPVLIVHGAQDSIVNVSYSEQADQVYENATLHIIPEGGHGFADEKIDQQALAYVDEFIKK